MYTRLKEINKKLCLDVKLLLKKKNFSFLVLKKYSTFDLVLYEISCRIAVLTASDEGHGTTCYECLASFYIFPAYFYFHVNCVIVQICLFSYPAVLQPTQNQRTFNEKCDLHSLNHLFVYYNCVVLCADLCTVTEWK